MPLAGTPGGHWCVRTGRQGGWCQQECQPLPWSARAPARSEATVPRHHVNTWRPRLPCVAQVLVPASAPECQALHLLTSLRPAGGTNCHLSHGTVSLAFPGLLLRGGPQGGAWPSPTESSFPEQGLSLGPWLGVSCPHTAPVHRAQALSSARAALRLGLLPQPAPGQASPGQDPRRAGRTRAPPCDFLWEDRWARGQPCADPHSETSTLQAQASCEGRCPRSHHPPLPQEPQGVLPGPASRREALGCHFTRQTCCGPLEPPRASLRPRGLPSTPRPVPVEDQPTGSQRAPPGLSGSQGDAGPQADSQTPRAGRPLWTSVLRMWPRGSRPAPWPGALWGQMADQSRAALVEATGDPRAQELSQLDGLERDLGGPVPKAFPPQVSGSPRGTTWSTAGPSWEPQAVPAGRDQRQARREHSRAAGLQSSLGWLQAHHGRQCHPRNVPEGREARAPQRSTEAASRAASPRQRRRKPPQDHRAGLRPHSAPCSGVHLQKGRQPASRPAGGPAQEPSMGQEGRQSHTELRRFATSSAQRPAVPRVGGAQGMGCLGPLLLLQQDTLAWDSCDRS